MKFNLSFKSISLIFLFSVCCLSNWKCSGKDDIVLIKGKAPERISKVFLSQNTGMYRNVAAAEVDSLGNYVLAYAIKQPEIFMMTDEAGRNPVYLFLTPGDVQQVDFKSDGVLFSGDGMENNQFLLDFMAFQFDLNQQYPGDMQQAAKHKRAAESIETASLEYIDKTNWKDKGFAEILKTTVVKNKYSTLLTYPTIYEMIFGVPASLDSTYYEFLGRVDFSSPYWKNVSGVYSLLQDLFQAMETHGYLQSGLNDYLLKRGEKIGDLLLREKYYLYALSINNYEFNKMETLLAGIESQITSQEGKAELEQIKIRNEKIQTKLAHLQSGEIAFDFTGTDAEGKQHHLSELKGKIVVVDVWNTGCKPCIAEMPFLKELEKHFEHQEVAFVSYSLDIDIDLWKKFITTKEMEGIQWIDSLGFKSDLVRNYALNGVPRFMVLGREGEIIDAFAPRPSDPRLAQLIERSLNK